MIYLRRRFKLKLLLFILIFISIYIITFYYRTSIDSNNLNDEYKDLASLPSNFVRQCQLVEKSSGIPWELFAAYYQVNIEEKLISNFPKEESLVRLSNLFQSKKSDKSLKDIISIKTNDKYLTGKIYNRYKVLHKHSYLFTNTYFFPISSNKTYFIDTWGEDRDKGDRPHLGTDIFAPQGTPIYAITNGTIEKIGWNRLGGNRIGLRGKDGLYYYYAHLKDFVPDLKTGDKILMGKLIGYVGNTGNAINTPDHLHFGIETGANQWINPYNFLSYWKEFK